MNRISFLASALFLLLIAFSCSNSKKVSDENVNKKSTEMENTENMKLGAFSISLSVKDLAVSRVFYEKFGFTILGGSMEQNYLIMKNETTLIGLFQGMFEGNIMTFNPGWDANGKNLESFDDIREIQSRLLKDGIKLDSQADSTKTGPASIMLTDPDGNLILLDQHR